MPVELRAERLVTSPEAPPAAVRLSPPAEAVGEYLHDESKWSAAQVASLAVPASLAALREVMAWHASRGHVVAVSGSRTGVAGGAVPAEGAHVVSLAALRGVLRVDVDADAPTATVLGGTWLRELTEHLAAHHAGLAFPVDPTEASASIGGLVSTNAGGARSFRFGSMRGWVEGLTVELPSGATLALRRGAARAPDGVLALDDAGARRTLHLAPIPKPATKHAIGYGFGPEGDPIDLWIGAEGTLGVVSTVTLRLLRVRGARLGYLQFFPTVSKAFAFVEAVRAAADVRTTALEFLDARSHALARESGKPAVERVLRDAGAGDCSVFLEVEHGDDAELEAAVERIVALAAAAGGDPGASLAGLDEGALRDIRTFRHAVPERINAIIAQRRAADPSLHKLATDMAVPDEALGWVHARYHERLEAEGLDFAVFGHVGNNHFHVNILPRDAGELARAKACYAELAHAVVARGGSVAAEHGIGRLKKGFLAVQYAPAVLDAFRAVKSWVDPAWRVNPGVLVDPSA